MPSVIKNTFIYLLLGFLSPALNFLLIPLYTQYLTPEHYGLIVISTIMQAILTNIIGIGIGASYQRFYFDHHDNEEYWRILMNTCVFINIFSAFAVAILLFFTGDFLILKFFNEPHFTMSRFGWWVLLTTISSVLQVLLLAEYRNQERADKYSIFSAAFFLCSVLGIFIGVVVLKKGAEGSIIGRSIGTFIPVFLYFIYYYSRRKFQINLKLTSSLISYGYPIMIYVLLTYLYNNVDRMIVSKYFDSNILGLYGFATSIAMATEIFVTAMNNTFKPKIYKQMKDIDQPEVLKEIRLNYQYIFYIMLFILISCIAFSMPAVKMFINENYHSAIIWLPLLFVSYISRIYYIVYAVPIFYYKKTKVMMPITVITLLSTVGFSILFMSMIGIYALIIVSFLSNLIQVISCIIYAKKQGIFNNQLYTFKEIHVAYSILIISVVIGYSLYYTILQQNILLFMGYNMLIFIGGIALLSIYKWNYVLTAFKLIQNKTKKLYR